MLRAYAVSIPLDTTLEMVLVGWRLYEGGVSPQNVDLLDFTAWNYREERFV